MQVRPYLQYLLVPALPFLLGAGAAPATPSADLEQVALGAALYKQQCADCHAVSGGAGANGPGLRGIIGAGAGSRPGFPYSDALAGSGLVWDEAMLDKWLADPAAMVPDNMMGFIGLKKADERAAIIAYLRDATAGE
jgi:cytochrome c